MTAAAADVERFAHVVSCPLCHTPAPTVSAADVAAGSSWRCGTCDQRWDAVRLAAVAAYAQFVAERQN